MSSIQVQGSSSGAGTITVVAPITANSRTLTLPDQNGTLLSSAGAISVNAATPASSLVFDAGGNLGVGTSLPLRKLVVSNGGAQGFEFGAGVGLSSGNELLNYNRSTGLYVQNTTYASAYAFYTGTAGTTRAVDIDSTGNIAIGTTVTSGAKFTVYTGSSATANSAVFATNDGTYNTSLQIQHSTAGIKLYNGNSQTATANNLIFGNTTTAETMRLDYNGNLFLTGAGTQLNTGFTNRLNVNGSIVAGPASGSTSGTIILQGQYGTHGATATFGTEYSSGGPSICYGVYPSNSSLGAFLSSSGVSAWRAAYTISGINGHQWYQSSSATTVPIGGTVTAPEVMRLDTNGTLLVGATATYTAEKLNVTQSAASTGILVRLSSGPYNSSSYAMIVGYDGTAARFYFPSNGGLYNYSANNFNLASDVRLKKNIEPVKSYWNVFKNINWKTWLYNNQTDDIKNIGIIAQELQELAPELINESNILPTPEGESPYLGIWENDFKMAGMSVITELVKRCEEQQELIKQLTERITVLENRQG